MSPPRSGEAPPCKQYEFLGNIQKARLSGKDVAHIPEAPRQGCQLFMGIPAPNSALPVSLMTISHLLIHPAREAGGSHPPPEARLHQLST